jgi:hypothetical protein
MPERLDDLLSDLAIAASHATRPPGPAAARKRGRQRVMRHQIIAPIASVAVVAAAAGVVFAATGQQHHAPAPTTHGHHTSGSATPLPSVSQTPDTTPSTTPTGAPSVTLSAPTALAAGTSNPMSFTVTNPGSARTVTVALGLGSPRVMTPSSFHPVEQAVAQRQDPDTGQWTNVPVTVSDKHDVASYQLALPAHGTAEEHLRVTPVGADMVDFSLSVTGAGFPTLTRAATLPLVGPTVTGSGPATVTRGTTSGVFDLTVTNQTPVSYEKLALYLQVNGSTAVCDASPFTSAQWYDNGTWQTVSLSQTRASLGTTSLAAGKSMIVQVRVPAPSSLPACLTKGEVSLDISTDPSEPFGSTGNATSLPVFQTSDLGQFFAVT